MRVPILCINGSDSTGQSGIGADVQTIAAMGGYAVTAVTCINTHATEVEQGARGGRQGLEGTSLLKEGQGARGKGQENTICPSNPPAPCPMPHAPCPLPLVSCPLPLAPGLLPLAPEIVVKQVAVSIAALHPKAIKVGLVTDSEAVRLLRNEVIASSRLVIAPGIFDADGRQMVGDDVVGAIARHLVPEALLLMLRCKDAEKMLGMTIHTDEDMQEAARRFHEMGAKWVLLRGGQHTKGRVTALLSHGLTPNPSPVGEGSSVIDKASLNCGIDAPLSRRRGVGGEAVGFFFTSHNIDGWQRHGVAAALSTAVTTRLGMGDDVPTAVRNAHDFIHSQVVYAQKGDERNRRAIDLYNNFVSLVAGHYREAHDVAFYANELCITTRYLSDITDKIVGKSPKQVIADYLTSEAKSYLDTTRLGIQEIADRLGFSSQALFCKFFKTQEKASPSEYRSRS